jgi:hypothetical protein
MRDCKGNLITSAVIKNKYDISPGELNLLIETIAVNGLTDKVAIEPDVIDFFTHHGIDVYNL